MVQIRFEIVYFRWAGVREASSETEPPLATSLDRVMYDELSRLLRKRP